MNFEEDLEQLRQSDLLEEIKNNLKQEGKNNSCVEIWHGWNKNALLYALVERLQALEAMIPAETDNEPRFDVGIPRSLKEVMEIAEQKGCSNVRFVEDIVREPAYSGFILFKDPKGYRRWVYISGRGNPTNFPEDARIDTLEFDGVGGSYIELTKRFGET